MAFKDAQRVSETLQGLRSACQTFFQGRQRASVGTPRRSRSIQALATRFQWLPRAFPHHAWPPEMQQIVRKVSKSCRPAAPSGRAPFTARHLAPMFHSGVATAHVSERAPKVSEFIACRASSRGGRCLPCLLVELWRTAEPTRPRWHQRCNPKRLVRPRSAA